MAVKCYMMPAFLMKSSESSSPAKTIGSVVNYAVKSIRRLSTSYKQKLIRLELELSKRKHAVYNFRELVDDLSVVRKLDFEAPYWEHEKSFNGLEWNSPAKSALLQNQVGKHYILGKGTFGTVIRATHEGQKIAVKKYSFIPFAKTRANHDRFHFSRMSFFREFCGLGLEHGNVVFIQSIQEFRTGGLIIMEYVTNVNLQTLLNEGRVKTYQDKIRYAREVCAGLNYCHQKNILHLDLKPQNVLLDSYGHCKITDFGCATLANSFGSYVAMGTIIYMAPELLLKKPPTIKCDMYSLGVTMWQLMSGEIPYSGTSTKETIIYKVVKENLRPRKMPPPQHPKDWDINEGFINIYERCWYMKPSVRPSTNRVLSMLEKLSKPNFKLPPLYYIIDPELLPLNTNLN